MVAEILAALSDLFSRGVAGAIYNASYDLSLLAHEARRYGLEPLDNPAPVVDPLVLDKAVEKYRKGTRTLEATALHYQVSPIDAHTAGADAVAAGRVAQALARTFPAELSFETAELHAKQITWAAEHTASFQEYMRRTHNPDFSDPGGWPVR